MHVAIIGAGPSGLALAKQLKDLDVRYTLYERDSALGGVWNIANKHSVIYESAHTISSKTMTEFSEFLMPKEYSDYISHNKMLEYLQAYATTFGLSKDIVFNCSVDKVNKTKDGNYRLTFDTKRTKQFSHVVVATGHASKANYPDLRLEDFKGEVLHSSGYKSPSIFKNKKILIIGAGNSGCDIACEAVTEAKSITLSVRRGYYYIPKFLFGMPADVFGETAIKLRLPMFVKQLTNKLLLRLIQGNIQKIGFPKPDHRFFESHPIINELLVYYVRHGGINICPDVIAIHPDGVSLKNGRQLNVDVIVLATGYKVDHDFLEESLCPKVHDLHLNVFSKKHHGLTFLGLIAPNGGTLGLLESQAIAVEKAIVLDYTAEKFLPLIQKNVSLNGGIQYVKSSRHRFEVDHATYRFELNKQIKQFELMS